MGSRSCCRRGGGGQHLGNDKDIICAGTHSVSE